MQIALVHRRLRGGGTETDLRRMASELVARGHGVELVVAKVDAEVPGARVRRVPLVRGGRVARLLTFALLAPRYVSSQTDVTIGFGRLARQDIVRVGGGTHASYLARMTAAGLRRQTLGPYHRAILALERRMFSPAGHRHVIAVSRLVQTEIVRDYAVPPAQISVLYNGVDLARFHPGRRAGDGLAIRQTLGIGDQSLCLAIGTGFARKGFDLLLQRWESQPPAAHLVIVGDDERLARYQTWGARLGGRVHVVGPQPDVERWLAAADLLVAPSRQEAFGNVVLEAMATGVPVVTSRLSGAAELIDGPLATLLIDDPQDAAALATAIARGLGPNAGERRVQARALAERHPWSQHVDRLESILKGVLRGR